MKSEVRKVNVSQRAEDVKAAAQRGPWAAGPGEGERPGLGLEGRVLESDRAAWTSPRNKAHGHGEPLATAHLENQAPG